MCVFAIKLLFVCMFITIHHDHVLYTRLEIKIKCCSVLSIMKLCCRCEGEIHLFALFFNNTQRLFEFYCSVYNCSPVRMISSFPLCGQSSLPISNDPNTNTFDTRTINVLVGSNTRLPPDAMVMSPRGGGDSSIRIPSVISTLEPEVGWEIQT